MKKEINVLCVYEVMESSSFSNSVVYVYLHTGGRHGQETEAEEREMVWLLCFELLNLRIEPGTE